MSSTVEVELEHSTAGFAIAHRLFPPEEVNQSVQYLMTQAKDGPVEGLSEFRHSGREAYDANDPLAHYPRMMMPHQHSDKPVGEVAMGVMLDARLEPILRDLFGAEEPLGVQSMFYFKPPGARGQDLHQDNFYLRVKPGTCIALWLAIDDADRENGGMVVVPGSGDGESSAGAADGAKFFTTEHVRCQRDYVKRRSI